MSDIMVNKEDVSYNFDLSIIMPFFHKMAQFRKIFPINHKYFERNGIEVILVLDTPDEKDELLSFIIQYPFVNWKIIMNDKPHPWRNPSKPLNVGIRAATKKYIMVCSPESEMLTDVPYILRKTFEDYSQYPHFAIGRVYFADDEQVSIEELNTKTTYPYGSIMFEKQSVELIHGYDENLIKWGGDDTNLRIRLEMDGVNELYISDAIMVHRDIDIVSKKRRISLYDTASNDMYRNLIYPRTAVANDINWGRDFNNVLYDWENNVYASELLKKYLNSKFDKYEFKGCKLKYSYPVLLLVQVYNEASRIIDFLKSMEHLFDGYILLDDGSSDGSYELAIHEKILLKVSKRRDCFNDLQNRNILLDLASFFKYSIACFIDADEQVDIRFSNFKEYIHDDAPAYALPYINIWDHPDFYNAEYPCSINGIGLRYKMFRNIKSKTRSFRVNK